MKKSRPQYPGHSQISAFSLQIYLESLYIIKKLLSVHESRRRIMQMTLKPLSDRLRHLRSSGYRSAKQVRTHMITGEGCSELALKEHVHEMFYKEQLAFGFVSNYKQLCRSCS